MLTSPCARVLVCAHEGRYEQQAAKVDSGLEGYHWDDPFAQHSQAAEMCATDTHSHTSTPRHLLLIPRHRP